MNTYLSLTNNTIAWTDGSVKDYLAGAGFFIEQKPQPIKLSLRLQNGSSIWTAEWWAIFCCLQLCLTFIKPHSTIIVFTDSLSNVLRWKSLQTTCRAVIESNLVQLNDQLAAHHISTIIHWIPSHSNIHGNDIADELAKAALVKSEIDIIPFPSSSRPIQLYNRSIRKQYCQLWSQRPPNAIYYTHKHSPLINKCNIHHGLPFKHSRWITWCFMNRAPLNGVLFHMKRVNSPACECGYFNEDLMHFLFDCPRWSNQRNQLYEDINSSPFFISLQSLLNSSSGRYALIKFIGSTQRFSQ